MKNRKMKQKAHKKLSRVCLCWSVAPGGGGGLPWCRVDILSDMTEFAKTGFLFPNKYQLQIIS